MKTKGFITLPIKIIIASSLFLALKSCCLAIYCDYSLNNALNYYGFTNCEQKQAMQNLFQKSSIISANETLDQAFPLRNNNEEIASDIVNVLQDVQKKFVIRSGTQERWEIKAPEWMNQNKHEILSDLKILGFVDKILPKQKCIDALCILGATAPKMADRIEYANSLVQSGLEPKAIILLAGERYVTKDIDGTEKQLIKIANQYKLKDWKMLTETHLIHDLYDKSPLRNRNITVHIIDTPRGDLPRPTTQTTILKLIEWLKNHQEIKSITFISNQPYVLYQKAIIDIIFKDENITDIQYEIVGNSVKDTTNLQPILESLGSYMWAVTPIVLSNMHIQIENQTTKDLLKELYSKNPLIYKALLQSSQE